MKKTMKKQTLVVMMLLITVVIAGCGSATTESGGQATMTMGELSEKIKSEVEFAMMMPVDINNPDEITFITETTGFTGDLVKDAALNMNMIVSADTLWLAEANSAEDLVKVQEAFEKQKANIIQSFEMYLPEPLEVAKDGEVVTKGNYVMLVMSQDNAKAIELFNQAIQ